MSEIAHFPDTIWDGSSDTRPSSGNESGLSPTDIYREPDAADYRQIVLETISLESVVSAINESLPYNALTYGAKADYRTIAGVTTAASGVTVTITAGSVTSADIGKWIMIPGAGAAGVDLNTTIATVGTTTMTVANATSTVVTSVTAFVGTDNSALINALIVTINAAGGGTLFFAPGSYACHDILLLSNVRLEGYGATLVKSGGTYIVNFLGSVTSTTSTLTANVLTSASTLVLTADPGLAKGDICLLFDSNYKNTLGSLGRNQEIIRIDSISGLTVTIAGHTYGSYTTAATVTLTKLDAVTNCIVEGLALTNPSLQTGTGGIVAATLAYHCRCVGLLASHASLPSFWINQSQYFDIVSCMARDGLGVSVGGTGYGIDINESCLHLTVIGCSFENVRENLVTNNTRCVIFADCHAHGCYDSGFNTHGSGNENIFFIGCTTTNSVQRGFTVGYGTDTAADVNIQFLGCRSDRSGGASLSISSSGSYYHGPITISDCHWTGWGFISGPSAYGVNISYADGLEYHGNTHSNIGGSATTALQFNNSKNSRLKGNLYRSLNGANGITYTTLTDCFIEDEVFNTTNGICIRGIAGNTRLTVRNCTVQGSGNTVTWAGDESSYGNVVNGVLDATRPIKTKTGVPIDANFNNPVDGLLVQDTTNNDLYVRTSSGWKKQLRFDGNGSSLTNITPANIDAGTAAINITGSAGSLTSLYTQLSDVTVANTLVASSLTLGATHTGSLILPASLWTPGRIMEFDASGCFSSLGAGPGTLRLQITIAGGSILTGGTMTMLTSIVNRVWRLRGEFCVRTIGASGTIMAQGIEFRCNSASSSSASPFGMVNTAVIVEDLTGTLTADVIATFSVADPANTITLKNFSIKTVNPSNP